MIATLPPSPAKRRHAVRFTVSNFKDGHSITFSIHAGIYRYRLNKAGEREEHTDATSYPQAMAKARRHYNLPPIGGPSYAKEIAA